MSIRVGFIEDLFWSNEKRKYPNTTPDISSFKYLKKSPVLINFLFGYINLKGNYNYCFYKGRFFFLVKGKPIDKDHKHFQYTLVLDMWCNILQKGGIKLVGTVETIDDEKILRSNLQYCKPTIPNPSETVFVNFKEKEQDWKSELRLRPIEFIFKQKVLSIEEFKNFKYKLDGDIISRYITTKKILYESNRNQNYVFSFLKGAESEKYSWKNNVKKRINKALEDFKKEQQQWVIQKVEGQFGKLVGKFVVNKNDTNSLSTKVEEGYSVEEIDLSNVYDIVAINTDNLKELNKANKSITENDFIFDIPTSEVSIPSYDWLWKICRRGYLPIASSRNKKAILNDKWYKQDEARGWHSDAPQYLTFYDRRDNGYLFWVDKVDFLTVWYVNSGLPVPYSNFIYYTKESVIDRLKEDTPPYGFLIFQMVKDFREWKGFEYVGEEDLKRIKWYSGISNKFSSRYSKRDGEEWFYKFSFPIAGSMSLSRMHVDLNNLLFLHFTPKSNWWNYGYEYGEFGQTSILQSNSNNYTTTQIISDIYVDGKLVRSNPYKNVDTYVRFAEQSMYTLRDITTQDELKLPWNVKKGDYLFSSIDYRIAEAKETWTDIEGQTIELWKRTEQIAKDFYEGWFHTEAAGEPGGYVTIRHPPYGGALTRFKDWFPTIGDFITDFPNANVGDILDLTDLNIDDEKEKEKGCVVLISNREGLVEPRILQGFSVTHKLRETLDQRVVSVDGTKNKNVVYYRLHRGGLGEIPKESSDKDAAKRARAPKEAIYLFYKANGYVVEKPEFEGARHIHPRIQWFNDEDLDGEAGVLFDLKGSDWYAFLRNGAVHFIAKNTDVIKVIGDESKKTKSLFLDFKDQESIKNLSLLSLINQKSFLQIYTQSYFIVNKFLFKDDDFISMRIINTQPTELNTLYNWKILKIKTNYDFVDDLVAIPKEESAGQQIISERVQRERLDMEMMRNTEVRDVRLSDLQLEAERIDTAYKRSKADLNYGYARQAVSSVFDIGSSLLSGTAGFLPRAEVLLRRYDKGYVKNAQGEIVSAPGVTERKYIRSSQMAKVFSASHVATSLGSAAVNIMDISRWGEMSSRLDEDRAYAARDIAAASFRIDASHLSRKNNLLLEMSSINNKYVKTSQGYLSLQKKYNEDHNLGDKYLRIDLPTAGELRFAERYREEFGVDCLIDDVPFDVYAGMPPAIIRFRHFNEESNYGSLSEEEKVWLEIKLIDSGIKIVSTAGAKETQLLPVRYVRVLPGKESELEAQIELISDEKVILEQKLQDADMQKNQYSQRVQALEAEIETCNRDKTAAETERDEWKAKTAEADNKLRAAAADAHTQRLEATKAKEEADACAKRVAAILTQKEELEGQLLACQRESGDKQAQIAQLTTKKEELEGQLLEETNKVAKLEKEKEKLGADLDDCIAERDTFKEGQDQSKQQLENRISSITNELNKKKQDIATQKTKIQTLTNQNKSIQRELIKVRADLDEKERQLQQCNTNLTAANRNLDTYRKSLADKEAELTQANNQVNLYRNEVDKCKKEVEKYTASIANKTRALSEMNKILAKLAKGEKVTIKKGDFSAVTEIDEAKLEEINSRLEENNTTLAQCIQQKEKLDNDKKSLEAKITAKDEEIKRLKSQPSETGGDLNIEPFIDAIHEERKNNAWKEFVKCFPRLWLLTDKPSSLSWNWYVYKEIWDRYINRTEKNNVNVTVSSEGNSRTLYYPGADIEKINTYLKCGNAVDMDELIKLQKSVAKTLVNQIKEISASPFNTFFYVTKWLESTTDEDLRLSHKVTVKPLNYLLQKCKNDYMNKFKDEYKETIKREFAEKAGISTDKQRKESICLYPTKDEYSKNYSNLQQEEWDKEFNIGNLWRLKPDEFRTRGLAISMLYYLMNNQSDTQANRDGAKRIFRKYIENIFTNRNFTICPSVNLSSYWKDLKQASYEFGIDNCGQFMQYIRTSWNYNTNEGVKNKFNTFVNYMRPLKEGDYSTPEKLKRTGELAYKFISSLIALGTSNVDLWKKYR